MKLFLRLTVVVIFWSTINAAYPEHAVTSSIKQDQINDASAWEKLTGWKTSYNNPGQYSSGLSLTDGSTIKVIKSGVYFISAHVIFGNLTGEDVSLALYSNYDTQDSAAMILHGAAKVQYGIDIDLTGFVQLAADDVISVHIHSTSTYKVCENSYFGVRLHDSVTSSPGFLFSMSESLQFSMQPSSSSIHRRTLGPWSINSIGQFSSSSMYVEGADSYQVAHDGIYMVTANIILVAIDQPGAINISLIYDGYTVGYSTVFLTSPSTMTLNINEILNLGKGKHFSLELSADNIRFNVLKTSTISFLLLKPDGVLSNGFHANLQSSYNTTISPNEFTKVKSWIVDGNMTFQFEELTTAEIVDSTSFSPSEPAYYYVSGYVVLTRFVKYGDNVDDFKVAFLRDDSHVFMSTKVQSYTIQPETNTSFYEQTVSVSLTGVFALTLSEPIGLGIKGNAEYVIIHDQSSFSVLQTSKTYPGIHASLNSPIIQETAERTKVGNWKLTGQTGLFDFTSSFEMNNGTFVATQNGVYLVTANLVLEDIDQAVEAYIARDINRVDDAFMTRDGNPVQKMPLNMGGLIFLEKGDELAIFLEAKNDEDWKVLKAGLSVSLMSINPTYFQAKVSNDKVIGGGSEINTRLTEWSGHSLSEYLNNGVFTAPYSGTYFTIASIDLDNADSEGFGSYYKIALQLNNNNVPGLYSQRTTAGQTPLDERRYYNLFFSGSFYAEKGSEITLTIQAKSINTFTMSDNSQWGLVFIPSSALQSGALSTLNKEQNFRNQNPEWQKVGQWQYPALQTDGTFEFINSISFEHPEYISITKDGMFLISANIELIYHSDESKLFKLGVIVNEVEMENNNGMVQWLKSKYKSQTMHICGTLYLKAGDQLKLSLSSADFPNTFIAQNSGFSVVLIPEAFVPSSFIAVLQNDMIIETTPNVEVTSINPLTFPTLLSTSALDRKNGVLTVPIEGYYMLSANIYYQPEGSNVIGAKLHVTVKNENITHSYQSIATGNSTNVMGFSRTFHFKAFDQVQLQVSPVYNETYIDTIYKKYVNSTNTTEIDNFFNKLDFLVQKQKSSLSLVYLENHLPSKSSIGYFTKDREFEASDDSQVLFPFTLPNNIADDGTGSFAVYEDGVFILSAEFHVTNVRQKTMISFVIDDNIPICLTNLQCISDCSNTMVMSCIAKLTKGQSVSLQIDTAAPINILKDSIRYVDQLTSEAIGFNLALQGDNVKFTEEDSWVALGPWDAALDQFDGFFMEESSFNGNEVIIRRSGTYQLSVNLLVNKIEPGQEVNGERKRRSTNLPFSASIMLAVFVNGERQDNLLLETTIDETVLSKTISLSGGLLLNKWDSVVLKMKSLDVEVASPSMFSATFLEPVPFSRVNDAGPKMYTTLSPSSHSTSIMAIQLTYTCHAMADTKIKYTWYKNGKVLFIDHNEISVLVIKGYINDTGTYECVAEANDLNATTNIINIDIYDIDECALQLDDCSPLAECKNTPGNYTCTCKHGLSGNGRICTDANECVEFPNICLDNQCVNKEPGYECECKDGFFGVDPYKINCNDTDECELGFTSYGHNCSEELGICTNIPGGYNCTCKPGYLGDGRNCTDENECITGNFKCDPNSECSNLNGTYECICNDGWEKGPDGVTCEDINDCELNSTLTHVPVGFCVENAVCVHNPKLYPGTYGCACAHGFVGNGTELCEDIDECLNVNCNALADCINKAGAYECRCRDGYQGDGFRCTDVNECETVENVCQHGNCTNKVGDFMCECDIGYRQNGRNCVPDTNTAKQVDDCEVDSSSFKCLCKDPEKRGSNIMCNGLFVALLILTLVAIVVIIFVVKYLKRKKDMKIRPVRTHRDKYIEMENESEF